MTARRMWMERTALASVAVATVFWTTPAPAIAVTSPSVVVPEVALAFSTDGNKFSDSVPGLFADAPTLVPGEGLEEKLWVRNDNPMAVAVSVAGVSSSSDLVLAGLTPVVVTLAPGSAEPLLVRVELPESAGNSSQEQTLPIRLKINVGEVAPDGAHTSGPGELGTTGASGGIWPWAVATMFAGALIFMFTRKRKDEA